MSQDQYPKYQVELLQAVQDMRDAQREYYAQPNDYRLRVAKAKEQKVDQFLAPYLKENVIKKKQPQKTNQQNLFNA